MIPRTRFQDLPTRLSKELRITDLIIRSFLAAVGFIVQDAAREEEFVSTHLLYYIAQDYIESAISIIALVMEGVHNVVRRELRFLIEASVKVCMVQQRSYASSIREKIVEFSTQLSSPSVSIKRNIILGLLPENLRGAFIEEVGRVYGLTSRYVHLAPEQILERIAAVDAGRTAGKESAADIKALNLVLSRGLACSLVLLFHSVPSWVAGDWLVEEDGSTNDWYFVGSRFLTGMDSHFDYKSEREKCLVRIQLKRQQGITF
jgi:hypothetical protein